MQARHPRSGQAARAAAFVLLMAVCCGGCGSKADPVQVGGGADVAQAACVDYARVQPILAAHCTGCHAASRQGAARAGAPVGVDLDDYAGARAHAERSNLRMQAGTMPPGGGPSSGERATFQAWLDAGSPEAADPDQCAAVPPDAGALPDAGADTAGPGGDAAAPGDVAALDAPCGPAVPAYRDEIATLLGACTGCHATTRSGAARGGAPAGVDYDNYTVAVANAARADARIQAGTMPPGAGLGAAERTAFSAWVAAGTPQEPPACPTVGDAAGDGAATELPAPPREDLCASGTFWTAGDAESPRMNPGRDCIGCHTAYGEGPRLAIAGTVFEHFQAPDLCLGPQGVVVEVTDATDKVYRLTTNASGNFLMEIEDETPISAFPQTPYRVRVLVGDAVRAMGSAQTQRSCNACHTESGAQGAPGRIVVPR